MHKSVELYPIKYKCRKLHQTTLRAIESSKLIILSTIIPEYTMHNHPWNHNMELHYKLNRKRKLTKNNN